MATCQCQEFQQRHISQLRLTGNNVLKSPKTFIIYEKSRSSDFWRIGELWNMAEAIEDNLCWLRDHSDASRVYRSLHAVCTLTRKRRSDVSSSPICPHYTVTPTRRIMSARTTTPGFRYFVFVSVGLSPGLVGYGRRLNVICSGSTDARGLASLASWACAWWWADSSSIRDFILSLSIAPGWAHNSSSASTYTHRTRRWAIADRPRNAPCHWICR